MTEAGPNRAPFVGLHCPQCDYDLSGTLQGVCPECGLAFTRADLMRTKPRYPKLTIGLCLLAMAATLYMVGSIEWSNLKAGNPIGNSTEQGKWRIGFGPATARDVLTKNLRAYGCALWIPAPLLLLTSILLLVEPGHRVSTFRLGLAGIAIALLVLARVVFAYNDILLR